VVVALWTFGFCLWKGPYFLLFPTENDNILPLVREVTDYLVSTVTRITAFGAGHEDLLFHLGWEKGGPAFRAKLQNVFSNTKASPANLEFIFRN
jgi:hypothetical protein